MTSFYKGRDSIVGVIKTKDLKLPYAALGSCGFMKSWI